MSLNISKHLDKNNLHHAYLIEGARDEIVPQIIKFLEDMGVNTVANSDFTHIKLDSFKIEDARNLKSFGTQKGFSTDKKIFIISANNFLLEAQNTLLKMFEEPIENTHFFIIIPDTNSLLKTFVSRFYLIKREIEVGGGLEVAEKFIKMSLKDRIDFIKELLVVPEEDEEGNEILILDSARSKAIEFLNALETVLHNKIVKNFSDLIPPFEHIFKVREFLRMPGSSTKSLMESVALIVPIY